MKLVYASGVNQCMLCSCEWMVRAAVLRQEVSQTMQVDTKLIILHSAEA